MLAYLKNLPQLCILWELSITRANHLTPVEEQYERLEDVSSSNSLRNFLCTVLCCFLKLIPLTPDSYSIFFFLKKLLRGIACQEEQPLPLHHSFAQTHLLPHAFRCFIQKMKNEHERLQTTGRETLLRHRSQ